jgi:hypothetical protein
LDLRHAYRRFDGDLSLPVRNIFNGPQLGIQTISSYKPSVWTDLKQAVWGRQHQAYAQWNAGGLGYVSAPIEFFFSPITGGLDLSSSYYRGRHGRIAPADRQTTDIALFAVGGARTITGKVAAAESGGSRGVAFFGESNVGFYTAENATLGAKGKSFFMMPLEDSAVVTNAGSAARYTGMSPSTLKAYKEGGDIFGISFPTKGMQVRVPTAADAGGWPHFLEGGHTAVRLEGPNAGYLVNPTREFVVPGGNAVPSGSVMFKVGPNGEWIPVRKF